MAIYSIDYSNKLVKRLNNLYNQITAKERKVNIYSYFADEMIAVPKYNFKETQQALDEIQRIIRLIKHEVRKVNMVEKVASGITADEAILELAFLNTNVGKLRNMAGQIAKSSRTTVGGKTSEITVCNYDINEANEEYNRVSSRIMQLQEELNNFNMLHQIKIDIDVDSLFLNSSLFD